ncbi:MAG: hypothetical protein ABUL69_02385 [Peristeroidobacter soli]
MKRLLVVLALAALQGCASVPVAAGGSGKAPTFIVLREHLTLTSFAVACEEKVDEWRTHWKITGETAASVIDFGLVPEGMKTESGPVPFTAMGKVCRVEIEARKKGSQHLLKRHSLWLLDDIVESCSTHRSCEQALIETIT